MPSGKRRDFDDTWKKDELEKSLKDSRRHKDRDRKHKDEDDDKRHRRKDDDERRKHRDKENGEVDRRDRDKHTSSRHKDEGDKKQKRHREDETEEERRKRKERERRHRDENGDDREKRHRDKNDEKEKRRRDKDDEREKRHRDKDDDRDKRHRDKDDDRERPHRSDRDRGDDKRRNKEDDEERKKRHEEKQRREKEKRRHEKEDGREKENERQRDRDREREKELEREQEKQIERERRRERERQERERKRKEEQEKVEAKGEEEDPYGDYEDDFEDYCDDFEDDEDEEEIKPAPKSRTEIDEVKLAMDEENERLLRESRRRQDEQSDDSFEEYKPKRRGYDDGEQQQSWGRPKTAQRTFINFTSAKQRHLTSTLASNARRRGVELSQIIELDIAKFDLFDMPPVSEYELYMRTFGSSNTRQAYIQTNEDNIEREIQTEEIETSEKWSQHPPEELECVGGPEEEKNENDDLKPIDQVKLGKFLKYAAQTMIYLIEEDRVSNTSSERREQKSSICLSEAFAELETKSVPILKGRHVIYTYFSPIQSHMLLTVYSQSDQSNKGSAHNSGVVCVWNVNEPHTPQKLLVCESRPRCCCFSPIKSHLAFAGMHDGSLAVWDLREPTAMHKSIDGLTYRYPTYSTAGVLQYENHQSSVISLRPIVAQAESSIGGLADNSEGEGLNFQLISLEEHSTINLWVVAEIGHPDTAGSQSELGLSPGGRVKLIKSSVINLQNPLRDARLRSTMNSYNMQLLPSNNSHFYVTTSVGCVLHGVRYGGRAPPRVYWTEETESLSSITSIDFSPFSVPVFLTGSEDGTLRLHHTECDYALITWPNATQSVPIQCVRWCRSRPSVFFVLDTRSRMHIWDLLMSDADAMKFEPIAQERVTSFELSNDHSATGQGMPGRKPQMVVCLQSGANEVHTVSREFSALMPDEIKQFTQLIQSFT